MLEKIVDTILDQWVEMALILLLFVMIGVPIGALAYSGMKDSLDVRGYIPHQDGERVTCVYNDGALYCSEE